MAEKTYIFSKIRQYALAAAFVLSLVLTASTQNSLKAEEHQFAELCKAFSTKLDSSLAATSIPGASATIVLPDGRICSAAFGSTRASNGRRLTPDDPILAASIGKTFVSALAMQLVEEGKLDLDKNISNWLGTKPWFERLPNARDITVRMLMNHTSGIPNHVEQQSFISAETKYFDKDVPYDYLVTFILGKKPLYAAGKGFTYSDTNYFLLAMIAEQITGTTMYDEIAARFLKPLKLDHTSPADKNLDPAVYGYYENKPVVKKGKLIVNPQWEWAGGGFWSTPTDLARWAMGLYSGKVLKPETLDRMLKGTSTGEGASYGLGVEILNTKLGASYGHDGDWPGYLSVMRYYPKFGLAVAAQINAGGTPVAEAFIDTISDDLARASIGSLAETKMMKERLEITQVKRDISVGSLDAKEWQTAEAVAIKTYWSGDSAPMGRQFIARLLWSDTALYVRFEANQTEPLVVSEKPGLSEKTVGLWDRDVCEIFIAPDKAHANKYFEFEIAPTGEWIDLGIEVTPSERLTDWNYRSGMESSARIDQDKVVMAIKVPFKALGKKPKAGDTWLGNLFRCVGKDPTRGYLAWRPTFTGQPNFHVPQAFGYFRFE